MPPPSSSSTDKLRALRAELAAMKGELRVVTVERDLLREKLKAYQRQLFASKSEVRGAEQRDLFLNEAEALAMGFEPAQETETEQSVEIGAHERKKRGRKPLDPMLPREAVRHELPELERVCAHDGNALVEIGAEISEQLDIVPQQVRVIQHQRIKYACPCCDVGINVTPAPARIIPKGLLTESALAWVVVSKFADALPLYRIAALLHRFGGDLSRGTLAASVVRVGTAVQPLINLMRDHVLEADIVYGDETTVQVLKEPGRAAQRKSYMWAQMNGTGPPVRIFSYSPTRSAAQAAVLYAGIKPGAVLMSDVYERPRLHKYRCSAFDRMVADVYPGLLQLITPLRPPMKSAYSHLTGYASLTLSRSFRFRESRSNLFCHHTRSLRNLSTLSSANYVLRQDYDHAGLALTYPF
jgi:transposase